MRAIMIMLVLSVLGAGCKSIKDYGEEREKKRAEAQKKEKEAPRSSMYHELNDYERSYVDDYYKRLDKSKKERKKKVFGF
jgi:hypothetical protein